MVSCMNDLSETTSLGRLSFRFGEKTLQFRYVKICYCWWDGESTSFCGFVIFPIRKYIHEVRWDSWDFKPCEPNCRWSGSTTSRRNKDLATSSSRIFLYTWNSSNLICWLRKKNPMKVHPLKINILSFHGWFVGSMLIFQGTTFIKHH